MKITRDIVTDLWPLYVAGEASPDSRKLIEEFLEQDREFAQLLNENGTAAILKPALVQPSPDLEVRSLSRTRKILQRRSWFRLLALAFTGLTIVRLIEDAPFEVASPRRFLATLIVAILLWTAHGISKWGLRNAA